MEVINLSEEQQKKMAEVWANANAISKFITSQGENQSGYHAMIKLKEMMYWIQDMLVVESFVNEMKVTHETVAQVQ